MDKRGSVASLSKIIDVVLDHCLTVSSIPGSPLSALACRSMINIINNHFDYTLVTKDTLASMICLLCCRTGIATDAS